MDIIARLESTREQTLRSFALSEDQLAWSYAPGKWPVRFILHHLADAETVLYDRIRRAISEPKQVLWAFDQDAWARRLDYTQIPLELSRQIYEAVRTGVIYQARAHYEKNGHLEFVHSETGVRTLKEEFNKVASHNAHHLEQIEMALAQARKRIVAPSKFSFGAETGPHGDTRVFCPLRRTLRRLQLSLLLFPVLTGGANLLTRLRRSSPTANPFEVERNIRRIHTHWLHAA